MLSSSMFLIPLTTLFTLLSLVVQRNRLLMALLSLEAMMLTLVLLTTTTLSLFTPTSMFLCLILLSFSACEASLGLACLVAMMRSYGTDQIKALTLNKC
uniref:NADH dehydrogenase subunit 4L n=1 Tax=Pilargis verrucosa TaxID=1818081 RepID=UPI0030E235A6